MLGAALNLLFVGNSLTAANGLPAMLDAMGKASGIAIRCTVVAKPDFSLEDHWTDGESRKAIARGGWSHVILQQGPSALPESRVALNDYAARFDREIRRVKARTAFFMVWPSAARLGDFDGVSTSYAGAARLTGGVLLPAGDAWRAAWRREPGLALYGPDGFHPSPLGSYLAALAIFHTLTGRLPHAPPAAQGISAHDFDILQAAVLDVGRHPPPGPGLRLDSTRGQVCDWPTPGARAGASLRPNTDLTPVWSKRRPDPGLGLITDLAPVRGRLQWRELWQAISSS